MVYEGDNDDARSGMSPWAFAIVGAGLSGVVVGALATVWFLFVFGPSMP